MISKDKARDYVGKRLSMGAGIQRPDGKTMMGKEGSDVAHVGLCRQPVPRRGAGETRVSELHHLRHIRFL